MLVKGEVLREDVVDVTCDICGNSCKKDQWGYEFATLKSKWGYDSRKDMEEHECEMCEDCYDKVVAFIGSLGGKVQIREYDFP